MFGFKFCDFLILLLKLLLLLVNSGSSLFKQFPLILNLSFLPMVILCATMSKTSKRILEFPHLGLKIPFDKTVRLSSFL